MAARDDIEKHIRTCGPQRPSEIAKALGKASNIIRVRVSEMVRDGDLKRLEDGRYELAQPPEPPADGPAYVRLAGKLIAHLERTPASRWTASEKMLVAEYWRAQRDEEERRRKEEEKPDVMDDIERGTLDFHDRLIAKFGPTALDLAMVE